MHCYEKEVNHLLLGHVMIQGHQKALKEKVEKHLSNDEFPLDTKELVIARHHFLESSMKNGNKEYLINFNNIEKIIPKVGTVN